MQILIYIIIACAVTGVITWQIVAARFRANIAVLQTEKEQLERLLADGAAAAEKARIEAENRLAETKADGQRMAEQIRTEGQRQLELAKAEAEKTLATTKTEAQQAIEREKAEAEERSKAQLAAMRSEIELATKKILEERRAELEQGNRSQLDQILKPFNSQLEEMKKAFNLSTERSQENSTTFKNTIDILIQHSMKLEQDTKNLTDALKNNGKVQGDWGEQVLAKILENSGLRAGIEYDVQENVRDSEGNNLRPDVIVNCTEGRKVIIDSKVSLTGFTHYVNATTEAEREAAERENLQSVKSHIKELVEKNYTSLVPGAVPYVLMFIPNEGSYILALQKDHNLAADAFQKHHVLLINPTNLMLALQLILMLWQFERKEENDRRIVEVATRMYEKFVGFAESFQRMGDQLQTVNKTYDTARGQLSDGRGNLIRQMEQLQTLGVTTTKKIPQKLTEGQLLD